MTILIVEDETRTAFDLKATVLELEPGAQILDIKDSVEGTITWLQSHPAPDLIFMDIQLADGLSFEIFNEVKVQSPVIFCTAFDEYALQAFQTNGVDYILKPFDREAVGRAMQKVKQLQNFFQQPGAGLDRLTEMLQQLKTGYKTSFLVSSRDKLLPISTSEVAYFYIEHEVTFLHTNDGKRYILNYTMEELEKSLDPRQFYRANRQFLVNYDNITEVEHYFARKLLVKIKTPVKEPMVVSKAKASEFLHWMETR